MKLLPVFLIVLLLVPTLGQGSDFESGFRAGYEDGSWPYRDYNFNLTARASEEFVSGYNCGYLLAKGVPAFMPFEGDPERYNEGFGAGYEDGSWPYRDYNFNLSARMKGADNGFFNGYVNGYILGHIEKESKEKNTRLQTKNDELEKRVALLENTNAELERRLDALEAWNAALERRMSTLEARNAALERRVSDLEAKTAAKS